MNGHISLLESGSSYAVTSSAEGQPTLQYFNEPIQALTSFPLQLRVTDNQTTAKLL